MPSPGPTTEVGTLARGATIGRFVVLGLVGRGGMGEVYAAYDPELDRKVALKLLRVKPGAGVSQSEGRARTLREAQAIARLSHPNVVVVFDVGTFEDKVFIAMEFVEGNTVTYWAESQSRRWQDVLKVFMAAGRGLAAAHEKGLVHRDFKPDNVMVGKDGEVRVMDFGLARAAPERTGGVRVDATSVAPSRDPARASGGRGAGIDDDTTPMGERDDAGAAVVDTSGRPGRGDSGARLRDSGARVPGDPASRVRVDASQRRGTPRYVHTTESLPGQSPPSLGGASGDGVPRAVDPNATMVINIPAVGAPDSAGNLVSFDVQLTRTGAMMGTPAYMAPEQFLGTPTDPRTDQFAFCIALYEALYGERPFAGNTMYSLTTNVVQGNVRPAPANTKVPGWIRKIVLRGLRPHADDRWPAMEDLLAALGKNPADARKKWVVAVGAPLVVLGMAVGIRQSLANREPPCSGGPAKLAGIWELRAQGEGESPRQAQIHRAFLGTGKGYAADVFITVKEALNRYARSWAEMRKAACEATQIRKEQSAEVLDLRMECLEDRLGGLRALTDVFADATGDVVENAVTAANSLGSLDRCTDVALLRAVVKPPEDDKTRQQVANLRRRLATLKARFDAGQFRSNLPDISPLIHDARETGYKPLAAEALLLQGHAEMRAGNAKHAEEVFAQAFWMADASMHDEVRAEAAGLLVFVVGYQQGRFVDGQRWAKTAEAVLQRINGHELLQAWLLNDIGCMYEQAGDHEAAVRAMKDGLAMKERALGRDHPDVGTSEGNLGLVLEELGRNDEALAHMDRSISLLEKGLGPGHPDLATQLTNRGEVLNGLRRYQDARESFGKARAIWEHEFGVSNFNVSYALTGIGESYLAEGRPENAIPPLERAYEIRRSQDVEPSRRAEIAFALARALWGTHRDHARARALAEEAKADLLKISATDRFREVEAWLEASNRSHG